MIVGLSGVPIGDCLETMKIAAGYGDYTAEERKQASDYYNGNCVCVGDSCRYKTEEEKNQNAILNNVTSEQGSARSWLQTHSRPNQVDYVPVVIPPPACDPMDGDCVSCGNKILDYNLKSIDNERNRLRRDKCNYDCKMNIANGHPELCNDCSQFGVQSLVKPGCASGLKTVAAIRSESDVQIPSGSISVNLPSASVKDVSGSVQSSPGGVTVLTLRNITTGNPNNINVGDTWQVDATGNVGDSVSVVSVKDGFKFGEVVLGTIGSDGKFTTRGNPVANDVGQWNQTWKVGGNPITTTSFIVRDLSGGGSSIVTGSGDNRNKTKNADGSNSVVDQVGIPQGARTSQANGAGGFDFSFLTDELISGIPNWALLGVGAVGVLMVSKG